MTKSFEALYEIVDALNAKFPEGNFPFQIISRLCEEAGEVAKEVNHLEETGVKLQKYGAPNPQVLAKEIQDVMRCALQLARYYKLEDLLTDSINESHKKLTKIS